MTNYVRKMRKSTWPDEKIKMSALARQRGE